MVVTNVPKLNLSSPSNLKRLESLEEDTSRDTAKIVQTERADKDVNPRAKKKKKKQKLIKRLSRRDSMMELLRDDLKNLDPLPAMKSYRPPSENDIEREDDVLTGEMSPFRTIAESVKKDLSKRRKSLLSDATGRSRRLSSADSGDVIVTGYELKKIRMIESLESMGYELPRARHRTFSSDEQEIMESMKNMRRNSLSTRLLQSVPDKRRRKSRSRPQSLDRNKLPTPVSREETDLETREKLYKMLNIVTKPVVQTGNSTHAAKTANANDYAKESLGTFRRKIRRKKIRPFIRWKRFCRFLVILLRSWKIHSQSVNSILGLFDTLEAITVPDRSQDLMFDVGNYKASKEASIAPEAKRILMKKPGTRTEEELHYVRVALRSYQSIVEYPVEMQYKIASKGWYECFDAKRVILREGHIPVCFYFILTGSAVVSYLDSSSNTQKTVLFLHRGDSFGEQAIMTQSLRQTTVISREKIELLTINDDDFIDIFMSGGLRDLNDPFITSLPFLKGWPLEKLSENPKKAIFSFFKRNTILVKDSSKSDWLFVIKSGSCSVYKKLTSVDPTRKIPKVIQKEWRQKVEDTLKVGASLSHEDQLTLLCEEEIKKLEQQNLSIRYYALPEINIATNEAYNDLRNQHQEMVQASKVKRAMEELKTMAADQGSIVTDPEEEEILLQNQARSYRRMSLVDLNNLVSKGPFMTKTKREDGEDKSEQQSVTTYPTYDDTYETTEEYATGYDVTQERAASNGPPSSKPVHSATRHTDNNSLYVIVNTLTKGEVFGLDSVVFDDQPAFSLVSNGAEVIMINKKFYMENLTTHQFIILRESVWPYPSDEKLQKDLETQIRWDYHKKLNLKTVLRNSKINNMNIHDARSSLQIPPITKDNTY